MRNLFLLLCAAMGLLANTVSYTYDAAGRLVRVDYGAGGSLQYVYDRAGNLTKRIITGPGSATANAAAGAAAAVPAKGAKEGALPRPAGAGDGGTNGGGKPAQVAP